MKNGGATLDVGEDGMCIVQIADMDSRAWETYKDWCCSLGDVDPAVTVLFAPDAPGKVLCPAPELIIPLLNEVRSIIAHMAPLRAVDFAAPAPVLPVIPGPIAPIAPLAVNVHHAAIAVTALLEKMRDPGPLYPAINRLQNACYICHIVYTWQEAMIIIKLCK
jgi:hypothetical protein